MFGEDIQRLMLALATDQIEALRGPTQRAYPDVLVGVHYS